MLLLLFYYIFNFHENYFYFFMFRDVPECSGMFRVPGFIDGQKIVGRKTSFSEKPEPTDHVHNRLTFLFRHFHVRKEEHT